MNSTDIQEHTRQFLSKGGAITQLGTRIGQNTGKLTRNDCRSALDATIAVSLERRQAATDKASKVETQPFCGPQPYKQTQS